MPALGLLATLKAKQGKEQDVEEFLEQGGDMAQNEEGTTTWYAIKMDDAGTYAIFDTFEDEAGRTAHLNGEIAAALMEQAPDLFAEDPDIKQVEILASK